jgi:RNA polymerase sigma factor (sigma-70 family)
MPDVQLSPVLRHIHQLVEPRPEAEATDAQLLNRFSATGDEAAFAALVHRHGRMVLGVCHKVLRQHQDAEDAFQATFLVLARKAGSIRWRDSVGNWLYGVACRVAAKARRAASRRRAHERRAPVMAEAKPDLDSGLREVQAVLAEEVGRLSDKYRAAFVCCCLEGMSRTEAARHLGWKEGTVAGRVAEARKRLQARLRRRGVTLTAALCAGAVVETARAVPVPLAKATIQAALGIAAGQMAGVSPSVAALMEGMTRTMLAQKLKVIALVLLTAGVLATAGMRLYRGSLAAAETPQVAQAPPALRPATKQAKALPAKEGEVEVRGRVLDPDGRPLAGAGLIVLPVAPEAAKAGKPTFLARTDGEGRFTLALRRDSLAANQHLAAVADGFGIAWVNTDTLGKGETALRLVKDLPIEGRILNLEGKPVRGAVVRVQYVEAAEGDDLTPVLQTWAPDGNRVSLQLTRYISGVAESGLIPSATTDGAGRFRLRGAGQDRVPVLRVEGPGIESRTLYVLGRPGVNVKELARSERRKPWMQRSTSPAVYGPSFDHIAGPSRPLVGVVRDKATGKPLAGVAINGSSSTAWWQDYVLTRTDAQGRYRLDGLPVVTSYFVTAYAADLGYLAGGQRVAGAEGITPLTQDFALLRGIRVKGRITDKTTGKPVDAALWYTPLADNTFFKDLPNPEWYRSVTQGLRTDKEGNFHVLALPGSGLIRVRAETDGDRYVQAELDPADRKKAYSVERGGLGQSFLGVGNAIETLSGHHAYRVIEPDRKAGPYTCDFQLDRGHDVTGILVDPAGKPVEGARAGGLKPLGETSTLSGASFTVKAMHPGVPRVITFLHKGRKLAGHREVGPKDKGPVRVELVPWGVVTGRLLDEDGKPVAGSHVGVSYPEDTVRWLSESVLGEVPTDKDGRFRIEGLIPGLEFGAGFRKGANFLDAGEKTRKLTVESGRTKDLGDLPSKVFRVP